jgi:hypothetical protein
VELVVAFPDTDLRRLAVPPATLDPAAAAEGRSDEVEGLFAGAGPGVSVLADAVGAFRAVVAVVAGVALAGFWVVDGLGTAGFVVTAVVRPAEGGRAVAVDVVELTLGARGAVVVGGLPIEPVVGFGFGAAAEVEGLEVEGVAAEGRVLAVVGLATEPAGFFGLVGGFLKLAAVSCEVVGTGPPPAAGGASGCSVSGVGGTSCT